MTEVETVYCTVCNKSFYKTDTFCLLLTYSIVQSPSWEANWFAASQEIPRILWNPKVHYRSHKRPPPVPILGQPNPVHIPTSHLLEIHPNIIHLSTPRSPQWSLSLRFPHQDPIRPPLLTHTSHMPREQRDTCSKFNSKEFEGKRPFGRTRRMWKGDISQYFIEIVFEGVLCIYFTRVMTIEGWWVKAMCLVP